MPNGLKTIIKEVPSAAVTAVQVWVGVGSADEAGAEGGLAHVLEHLLFRGSSEKGTGKLAGEVENLGGTINGFTSRDHTVYHLVLPALHSMRGLEILAQMMQLPALGEPELRKEIQVVLEEFKQGQDNPRARATSALFRAAYKVHPYGRPVLGTPESLGRITWELVSRFYRRWYSARNMTVVVVGNFETELLKQQIRKTFAFLPDDEPPSRSRPAEPPQEKPRVNILKAPFRQGQLVVGFNIPTATARDTPALDLLAFILGRGESSRLAERVKTGAGLVNSISASTYSGNDPGQFLIQAQVDPGKSVEALRAILKEVYRLREEAVSRPELNRAYVNYSRTFVERKETVEGQARQLGAFYSLYGDPDHDQTYLRAIRQLDAEALRSAARAYFRTENLSLSLLVPEETASLPDPQDIAKMSRSLEIPTTRKAVRSDSGVVKATLENGLRILLVENRRLPVVSIHAGAIGGLFLEDQSNNGIHNFVASMMTQGTPRLTSAQLVHEVEHLGGMLSGASGNNTLSLTGTFPSHQLEKGLEIFFQALFHPTFPEEQLEKKRREILASIDNREERFRTLAYRLFYETLFRNHPYRFYPAGQKEQVTRFSRETLLSQHQKIFSPERVVLAIVGDIDVENTLRILEGKLSPLRRQGIGFSLPPAQDELQELRVNKKSSRSRQAHLVLGFPAPARGQDNYFTMRVLQTILSRFGGRLFVELRDRQALAYSVGAFSLPDPLQGAFGIYAATDPANVEKMREGILAEIRRLQTEEISSEELDRAKNYLIGNRLIARQTNASRASGLVYNELFGFGTDYERSFQEGVKKVTATDIVKFARGYLPLDRYALAVVGP